MRIDPIRRINVDKRSRARAFLLQGEESVRVSSAEREGEGGDADVVHPSYCREIAVLDGGSPSKSWTGSASLYRPNSVFLAHLIATKEGAPQTRRRRRVDLAEGVARYQLMEEDLERELNGVSVTISL